MNNTLELAGHGPVIPVIVLQRVQDAVPLAQALVAGGVRVLEVTMRTPVALQCIEAIARAVPEAIVGAGTIRSAATAGEVMAAQADGLSFLKFFPATAAGGIPMLKALGGPFPDVVFCPTGGITLQSAPQFLALANVKVCGGSWLTPADAVAAGDWAQITRLAQEASALRG